MAFVDLNFNLILNSNKFTMLFLYSLDSVAIKTYSMIKNKLFFAISLLIFIQLASYCKKGTIETEVITLAKTTTSWDGNTLPAYPEGQPEVTILKVIIPAGEKLSLHKHPVINAGIMLKGELTIHKENGDTFHINEGDAIVEVVETWHYGQNDGDTPAEIVVFYVGIEGDPITILTEE